METERDLVTRASKLPLHPQDEIECRRCGVHCDKVVYPAACVERGCSFLYSYREFGHTYVGCMQKVFDVEIDLDATHRQRLARGLDRAELARGIGRAQEVDVDLHVEDLLHAADVGVAELLVRVEERALGLDARGRVDDLVAMDTAAPAFDLVLWVQRQRARAADEVALGLHGWILGERLRAPQDLTTGRGEARRRG